LDRKLGGPQSRFGRRGEEKILDPTGTRNPTPRSSSPWPVAIPTALSSLFIRIIISVESKIYAFTMNILMIGRTVAAIKYDIKKELKF
jgi:hypothetical protein